MFSIRNKQSVIQGPVCPESSIMSNKMYCINKKKDSHTHIAYCTHNRTKQGKREKKQN